MKYKLTAYYEHNDLRYYVYKYFKEGYEVKKTNELKNFKFNTLKEVNAYLKDEGVIKQNGKRKSKKRIYKRI